MDIIIIILMAIASFFISMYLEKITKLPNVIYLMILGVILGSDVTDLVSYLPSISKYSTLAIVLLFLVSGYGLSMKGFGVKSRKTTVLASLPAIIEGLVAGIITWLLLSVTNIFGVASINIAAVLAVMFVFAMSSPAIIVPYNLQGKERAIKSSIFDELTIASVVDNFLPFPLVLIALNIAFALESGTTSSPVMLILQMVGIVVGCTVIFAITMYGGKYLYKLLSRLNNNTLVAIALMVVTTLIFLLTGTIGATVGVIVGFGIGVGVNSIADDEAKAAIMLGSQKIYALAFMPVVFIYIGTQVMLEQLLNPITVATFAVITIISVMVKGYFAKWWLKNNGSSEEEANYAFYSFAAKGKILINISLVIGVSLQANGLDYILQMMYILAAVSIVITFPYASYKLNKQLDVLQLSEGVINHE